VKYLDRISDNNPVPEAAIQRYKIGVARALRILCEKNDELERSNLETPSMGSSVCDKIQNQPLDKKAAKPIISLTISDNITQKRVSILEEPPIGRTDRIPHQKRVSWLGEPRRRQSITSVQVKSHRGSWIDAQDTLDEEDHDFDEEASQHTERTEYEKDLKALKVVSKAIEIANPAYYFKDMKSIDELKEAKQKAQFEQGVFLRADVAFNPDSKERFWYNSINVLGCYAGLAMYSCTVSVDEVHFRPTLKWVAAFYAVGISFSSIVYTRTILRSLLTRTQFKAARMLTYFFLGFFTYGIFPLSYLALERAVRKD